MIPDHLMAEIDASVQATLVVVASEQNPLWRGRFTMDVHRRVMDAIRRADSEIDRRQAEINERWETAAAQDDAAYREWCAYWESLTPEQRDAEIRSMDAHVAQEIVERGEQT